MTTARRRRPRAAAGTAAALLLAACSLPGAGPPAGPAATTTGTAGPSATAPSSTAPLPATTGTLLVPVEGYAYTPDDAPLGRDLGRVLPRLREYGRPLRDYRVDGPDGFIARALVVRLRASVELDRNNRDVIDAAGPYLLGDDVVLTALSSVTFALTPQREGRPTVVAVHTDGLLTVVSSEQREPLLSFVEDYIAAAE